MSLIDKALKANKTYAKNTTESWGRDRLPKLPL